MNYTDAYERLRLIRAIRPALDGPESGIEPALTMAKDLVPACVDLDVLRRVLDDEAASLEIALHSADVQF